MLESAHLDLHFSGVNVRQPLSRIVQFSHLSHSDCVRYDTCEQQTHERRGIFVTNHSQFKKKEANVGDVFNGAPPPASFFVNVCNEERQCICRVFVSR